MCASPRVQVDAESTSKIAIKPEDLGFAMRHLRDWMTQIQAKRRRSLLGENCYSPMQIASHRRKSLPGAPRYLYIPRPIEGQSMPGKSRDRLEQALARI